MQGKEEGVHWRVWYGRPQWWFMVGRPGPEQRLPGHQDQGK